MESILRHCAHQHALESILDVSMNRMVNQKGKHDASCCGHQRHAGTYNASHTGTGIEISQLSRPPLQFTSASALHNYHLQVVALLSPSSLLYNWAPLEPKKSTLRRQASW